MKKILSVLICMSMIFNMHILSVKAAEEQSNKEFDKAFAVLKYIDVVSETKDEFDTDRKLTRAEFASYVAKALKFDNNGTKMKYFADVDKEYWASGAINSLVDIGAVVGENKRFEPERNINVAEAVTILLKVCGYKIVAEQKGGYSSGYLSIANEKKLLNSIKNTSTLSAEEALILIYNAFKMGTYCMSNKPGVYFFDEDRTIFGTYQNIYIDKGVFEGGFGESIYENVNVGKNEIVISSNIFESDNKYDCTSMLGDDVEYAYQKNNDENVIIFTEEKEENETTIINGNDIESFEQNTYRITYLKDNKRNNRVISIPFDAQVIFNGVASNIDIGKEIEMFISGERTGKIYLKSKKKKNDLVIIESYTSFKIDTINKNEEEFRNDDNSKVLLFSNYDIVNVFNSNGKVISSQDIKKSDVLSVAASNNNRVANVYMCNNVSESVIESLSFNNKSVVTNNGEFNIPLFTFHKYEEILKISNNVRLYFDAFENVIYAELISNNSWEIGYIIDVKITKDEHGEDCVMFKLLNNNNSVEKLNLSKKITVDEQMFSGSKGRNKSDLLALSIMPGISGLVDIEDYNNSQNRPILAKQIIRYKTNKNEEITEIDTYLVRNDEDEDYTLTKRSKIIPLTDIDYNGVYKLQARQIISGSTYLFGMECLYSKNKSMLFNVPTVDENEYLYVEDTKSAYSYTTATGINTTYALDESGNKIKATDDMYYVGGRNFTQAQWYNIDSYNFNAENPYEDIVVYNYGAYQFYIEPIMVDKINVGIDKDDTIVNKLQGYSEGKNVEFDIATDDIVKDLKTGDIIRGYVDGNNKLTLIDKVFDYETRSFVKNGNDSYYTNTPNPYEGWFSGTVPLLSNGDLNKNNNSALYYNTAWQMSYGKVVDKNGTVLKWKYPGENEQKYDEVYDFSQLATFVVYDGSLPKNYCVYLGTIDDVDKDKTDIVFTSRSGYAKNVFIYK